MPIPAAPAAQTSRAGPPATAPAAALPPVRQFTIPTVRPRPVAAPRVGRRGPVPDPEPDGPLPPEPDGFTALVAADGGNAWLDRIAAAIGTRTQINLRTTPEISQLAAIPPQHYTMLLKALDRRWEQPAMRACLDEAVKRAARSEHCDLLLAAFPRHPDLAEPIVRKGWSETAAPIMRAWLKAGARPIHYGAYDYIIEALVRVGDPADIALLDGLLASVHLGDWQARYLTRLERMPGYALREAVRTAWSRTATAYGHEALALPAARQGVADALPVVIACAIDDPGVQWRSGTNAAACRAWLAGHFGLPTQPAAIAAWWKDAQGHLVWDDTTDCWQGPPPPAVLPEAVPSAPEPAAEVPVPPPSSVF